MTFYVRDFYIMDDFFQKSTACKSRLLNKISEVDKLQLFLRGVMFFRGLMWKLYVRAVMKAPHIGKSFYAIGWPKLTHRNGRLIIGDDCFLGTGTLKVTKGAILRIGNRVLINNGFVITSNEHVEIGADTLIGEYVSIRDADHAFSSLEHPIASQGSITAPVRIGEDVWIGRGTVILKGITIGRGVIVGANSVVTRDVAPYDIVAGSPAKILRSRLSDSEDEYG